MTLSKERQKRNASFQYDRCGKTPGLNRDHGHCWPDVKCSSCYLVQTSSFFPLFFSQCLWQKSLSNDSVHFDRSSAPSIDSCCSNAFLYVCRGEQPLATASCPQAAKGTSPLEFAYAPFIFLPSGQVRASARTGSLSQACYLGEWLFFYISLLPYRACLELGDSKQAGYSLSVVGLKTLHVLEATLRCC